MKFMRIETLKGELAGRAVVLDEGTGFISIQGIQYQLVPGSQERTDITTEITQKTPMARKICNSCFQQATDKQEIQFAVHFKKPKGKTLLTQYVSVSVNNHVAFPVMKAQTLVLNTHEGKEHLAGGYKLYGITQKPENQKET